MDDAIVGHIERLSQRAFRCQFERRCISVEYQPAQGRNGACARWMPKRNGPCVTAE
ncbi:hypothetical protein RSSE_c3554 [Ralstonia solanacearum]|nr:hypothetical protein RSSE_c3554 [Ralstonia solanacearum]